MSLTPIGHQHDKNNTDQNRTNETFGFRIDRDRYCSDAKGEPEWQVYFRLAKGVKKYDMLA